MQQAANVAIGRARACPLCHGLNEDCSRGSERQCPNGVTARPWWRPPYGDYDERTNELAASIGYTNVLMWNGSYGDAALLTPEVLLAQAEKYLEPGVVMLGHANHPTVTHLFSQIAEIIASRDLHPVTLDEMFGTSRSTGRSTSTTPECTHSWAVEC